MHCPICEWPLESATVEGQAFQRCLRCGGEYFGHQALEELLSAHAAPPTVTASAYRRPSPLSDPVHYRKCPSCGEPMLRRNFRETSGVIVDVCMVDGIWLDHGELATLVEFAATGALAAAEQRLTERAGARRRLDAWGSDLRALGPRHYLGYRPVDMIALEGAEPRRVLSEPDARSDRRSTAYKPRDAPVPVVPNRNAGSPPSAVCGPDALPYRGGLPLSPPVPQTRGMGWVIPAVVLLLVVGIAWAACARRDSGFVSRVHPSQ
jgi:Zn-finger nucleic acid-binding protein